MKRRNFIAIAAGATVSAAGVLPTAPGQVQGSSTDESVETGNDYFEFSPDSAECLIKRYDTPVQWLNLLNNGRLVAWVAHDGTIVESCVIDNKDNRLTNPQSGYIYIRDAESGEYFLLNRPTERGVWSAAQGLGYTRVTHSALELNVSTTYFVPRNDDVIVWSISIGNKSLKARTIDVFSVVEWCLGDVNYSSELPGGDFHSIYNNFKKISFDGEILYGSNYSWGTLGAFQGQKVWPYTAFLTSSLPVKGFDCDKTSFFGRRIDIEHPASVAEGRCASEPAFGFTGFPLGVLQNSVHLGPGAEQKFAVVAGVVREAGEASNIREKYAREGAADKALQELKQFWKHFTGQSLWVDTPEKEIDRLVNIWIKFQHRNSMLENLNTKRIGFGIWCPAYSYGGGRLSDIRETGNVTSDLNAIREDILDYLHGGPLLLESDLKMKWEEPKCTPPPLPYPHDGRGLWPYPVCWYLKEAGDLKFLDTPITNPPGLLC